MHATECTFTPWPIASQERAGHTGLRRIGLPHCVFPDRMRRDGFTSFLDFRFALNPRCPTCSAQRTMSMMYGMTAEPVEEPWIAAMGCCVEAWEWRCAACGHQW
jgi:hypothetical protein